MDFWIKQTISSVCCIHILRQKRLATSIFRLHFVFDSEPQKYSAQSFLPCHLIGPCFVTLFFSSKNTFLKILNAHSILTLTINKSLSQLDTNLILLQNFPPKSLFFLFYIKNNKFCTLILHILLNLLVEIKHMYYF